jgi:hypothetical protein
MYKNGQCWTVTNNFPIAKRGARCRQKSTIKRQPSEQSSTTERDRKCWYSPGVYGYHPAQSQGHIKATTMAVQNGDYHLYRRGKSARSLLFVQIFAGNIVLRHLMRANFPTLSVPSVFHAHHYVGLERVSFLEQLLYTLRIRTFDVG